MTAGKTDNWCPEGAQVFYFTKSLPELLYRRNTAGYCLFLAGMNDIGG